MLAYGKAGSDVAPTVPLLNTQLQKQSQLLCPQGRRIHFGEQIEQVTCWGLFHQMKNKFNIQLPDQRSKKGEMSYGASFHYLASQFSSSGSPFLPLKLGSLHFSWNRQRVSYKHFLPRIQFVTIRWTRHKKKYKGKFSRRKDSHTFLHMLLRG